MTIPPGSDPEIRGVLDRSALQSYAVSHVHVGELIREIADEDNVVAIPAATLAQAHVDNFGDDHVRGRLRVISTLEGTTVLDLDREVAASMAGTLLHTQGDMSKAQAVWTANKYEALFITTEPGEVKGLIPEGNLLVISKEDA
jgi:hypothetical protein